MTKKPTLHDKYDSKNIISQKLIAGFMNTIDVLTQNINQDISNITECGCGQGHVNRQLEHLFPEAKIKGFDIAKDDILIADSEKLLSSTQFYHKSIYDLDQTDSAQLMVCCEVLEHLVEPHSALKKMAACKADYYLFSVPNEPIWRILNMARGKYLKDWGNTPDHRNHWSTRKFCKFISTELNVLVVKKPLPWSMVLATSK
ncbi:MAG: class I SAM-dependent methyltransferase [Marinicella sp.]